MPADSVMCWPISVSGPMWIHGSPKIVAGGNAMPAPRPITANRRPIAVSAVILPIAWPHRQARCTSPATIRRPVDARALLRVISVKATEASRDRFAPRRTGAPDHTDRSVPGYDGGSRSPERDCR